MTASVIGNASAFGAEDSGFESRAVTQSWRFVLNTPHVWPRLFTCPKDGNFADGDLGMVVFNPVYGNRDDMLQEPDEGCKDCDMVDTCPGPVEYAPVLANVSPAPPDGDALQRGSR